MSAHGRFTACPEVRYRAASAAHNKDQTKRFQLCQTLRASPVELGGLLFLLDIQYQCQEST